MRLLCLELINKHSLINFSFNLKFLFIKAFKNLTYKIIFRNPFKYFLFLPQLCKGFYYIRSTEYGFFSSSCYDFLISPHFSSIYKRLAPQSRLYLCTRNTYELQKLLRRPKNRRNLLHGIFSCCARQR